MRQLSHLAIAFFLLEISPTLAAPDDASATKSSSGIPSDDGLAARRRNASYATGAYDGQYQSTTSATATPPATGTSASPIPAPPPSPKPPPAPPVPSPGTVSVPEPGSWVLLCLGILALGVASRRFGG